MAADTIKSGDYAIADENGEKKSIVLIRDDGSMRVGKVQVSTSPLVGAPWGSMWELLPGADDLTRVTEMPSQLGPKVEEVEKNNSQLVDRNEGNQALKAEDIEELKRQAKAGTDIVEALCSNSATFETKTEFAQDKYIKRKSKKYVLRVTLRRPTGRTLCEALFEKSNGSRTWNLRADTLAAALCFANAAANARVLVVESCQGLLAAAAAERLGGAGDVCCAAAGDKAAPPIDCVRMMNFDEQVRGVIRTTTLAALVAAAKRAAGGEEPEAAPAGAAAAAGDVAGEAAAAAAAAGESAAGGAATEGAANGGGRLKVVGRDDESLAVMDMDALYGDADAAAAGGGGGLGGAAAAAAAGGGARVVAAMAVEDVAGGGEAGGSQQQQQDGTAGGSGAAGGGEEAQQEQQHHRHSYTATPDVLRRLVQPGFSSCIIACPKLHTASLLRQVLPLLAPSAPFVVYSPWQQPLAEAMAELSGSGRAVMLQLSESWMRPYQVLPGRTHPHMTTFGTGGYLLSGIKVIEPEQGEGGGGRGGGGGGGRGARGGRAGGYGRGSGRGRPPKRQRAG